MAVEHWTVYILRCNGGALYTGVTNDLARRVDEHGRGVASKYTRSRLPVALVWNEPADSRSVALRREAAIKRLNRAGKLALIRAAGSTGRTRPRRRALSSAACEDRR